MPEPKMTEPALTLTVVTLVLVPPSCRAPRPALTSVAPPETFALRVRPTCSLKSPRVPSTRVPVTWSTVMVALLGSAMLPVRVGTARGSSRLVALMLPLLMVSTPAPVWARGPPSL